MRITLNSIHPSIFIRLIEDWRFFMSKCIEINIREEDKRRVNSMIALALIERLNKKGKVRDIVFQNILKEYKKGLDS